MVMVEILQVERETTVWLQFNKRAHLPLVSKFAVRGQSHDFVLIPIPLETEEVRYGFIENPQRVGEVDLAVNLELIAVTPPPCRAGEIAEAIDGKCQSTVIG